jgi:hypothetical protein
MPSRQTIIFLAIFAIVFGGSILWSIFFETLLPLLRMDRNTEFWLNVIGIPILFVGVGLLTWGGFGFVLSVFGALSNPALRRMTQASQDAKVHQEAFARSQSALALRRAMQPALIRLALGVMLMVLGSLVINWLPGVLG